MLKIKYNNSFKKDYKRIKRRGLDVKKLEYVIRKLSNGEALEERYRDHELIGNYRNFREYHIKSDWLLIYKISHDELILVLSRTGTYFDLF